MKSCGCGGDCADVARCSAPVEWRYTAVSTGPDRQPACGTLLGRLGPRIAKLRAATQDRFGTTAYDVWMVWQIWSGSEAGEGAARELGRVLLIPRPSVSDLASLNLQAFSGGVLPTGTLRLDGITSLLTADQLQGRAFPDASFFASLSACAGGPVNAPPGVPAAYVGLTAEEAVQAALSGRNEGSRYRRPPRLQFFWEIVETGVPNAERMKFRTASVPFRRRESLDWTVAIERMSEDRSRAGLDRAGIDPDE